MSSKNKIEVSQAMRYSEDKLDFTKIITLPQMRTDFDPKTLQELADSIAESKGMISLQIVATFSPKDFWSYSEFVCTVYRRKLSSIEMRQIKKKIGKSNVRVMIAGERRLRALGILWNQGCSECQKQAGSKVGNGQCWKKHMGTLSKVVTIRVPATKDPVDLLGIQLAENVHSRPNTYEEADAIAKFAVFLKATNNKMSYEKMAERMGRSPEMIRKALSFYALPTSIRNMVRDKIVKYGFATELARLQDQVKYSEEDLLRELNVALADKRLRKVEVFADHVSGLIKAYIQKQNATITTLEMVLESVSSEKMIASWLSSDTQTLARILMGGFSKILSLWENVDNKLFTDGKLLSVGGFVEDYAKVVPLMEKLLPYVEKGVTVDEAKEMRSAVVRIKRILHHKEKQLAEAS